MEKIKKMISRKTVLIIIAAVILAGIVVFIIHRVMYVKCVVEPLDRAAQAEGFGDAVFIDPADGQVLLYDGKVYEKETELCGRKGKLRLKLATNDHSKRSIIEFECDEPDIQNGRNLIISASIYPYDRLWWDSYEVGISYHEDVASSEIIGGAASSVNIRFKTDIDGELRVDADSEDRLLYKSIKDEYLDILNALNDEYKRMSKGY